jgi:hypothetical protein
MAIASTLYVAALCVVMLFSVRAKLMIDLRPELGMP